MTLPEIIQSPVIASLILVGGGLIAFVWKRKATSEFLKKVWQGLCSIGFVKKPKDNLLFEISIVDCGITGITGRGGYKIKVVGPLWNFSQKTITLKHVNAKISAGDHEIITIHKAMLQPFKFAEPFELWLESPLTEDQFNTANNVPRNATYVRAHITLQMIYIIEGKKGDQQEFFNRSFYLIFNP